MNSKKEDFELMINDIVINKAEYEYKKPGQHNIWINFNITDGFKPSYLYRKKKTSKTWVENKYGEPDYIVDTIDGQVDGNEIAMNAIKDFYKEFIFRAEGNVRQYIYITTLKEIAKNMGVE